VREWILIILCTKSSRANPAGRGGADEGARAIGPIASKFLAQDDKDGALPTLYTATQDLPGASHVGPDGRGEPKGDAGGDHISARPLSVGLRAAAAARLHSQLESGTFIPYSQSG